MATKRTTYPPKITRPDTATALPRERLFAQLDEACARAPLVWVSAPGGSGKTTLVSGWLEQRGCKAIWYQVDERDRDPATLFHYLTLAARRLAPRRKSALPQLLPELLPALPAFARRFFEALTQQLGEGAVLVFDNAQCLDEQSEFYALLPLLNDALAGTANVIVLSRRNIVPSLVTLEARGQVNVVGWEDVRFSYPEWQALYRHIDKENTDEAEIQAYYQQADGWVAALVLEGSGHHIAGGAIHNYFSEAIFSQLSDHDYDPLLTIAYLPYVSSRLMADISASTPDISLFKRMAQRNEFVVHQSANDYVLHPLLRDHLQYRYREQFGDEEVVQLQVDTANALCANGEVEEGIALLCQAGEWGALCDALNESGDELLAHGRHKTLSQALQALPDAHIENSARFQWMLGNITVVQGKMHQTLVHWRNAIQLAEQEWEVMLLRKTLLQAVQTICGTVNGFEQLPWFLERLQPFAEQQESGSEDDAQVLASLLHGYLIADLDRVKTHQLLIRAEQRLQQVQSPQAVIPLALTLVFIYCNDGNSRKLDQAANRLRKAMEQATLPPDRRQTCDIYLALSMVFAEAPDCVLRQVDEALQMVRNKGLQAIFEENLQIARARTLFFAGEGEASLPQVEAQLKACSDGVYRSYYLSLIARVRLSQGMYQKGLDEITQAIDHFGEHSPIGWLNVLLILKAELLFRLGERQTSHQLIYHLYTLLKGYPNRGAILHLQLLEAALAAQQGDSEQEHQLLRQALAMGREQHIKRFMTWSVPLMSWACQRALELAIEPQYVEWLIEQNRKTIDPPTGRSVHWPWPVRIHLLGPFRAELEGGGASGLDLQTNRLLMLLALFPEGLESVQAAELLYADDTPSHRASAFRKVLHRLRARLGVDEAIIREQERLRLNPRLCWVDADAFEALLAQNDAASRARALKLYRGELLPGESLNELFLLGRREALRSRFHRAVLEQLKTIPPKQGIELCLHALAIEPLVETFYQRLIELYTACGQSDLAQASYDQCRRLLHSELGIEPMAATRMALEATI